MTDVRIETYGCSMNKADSEAMMGLLEQAGFSFGDSGILVINTCTVKTPTERKILRRLKELRGKKVVVSGCLPAATPSVVGEFPEFSFLGLNVEDVVEAVKAVERGERFVRINTGECRLRLPKKRQNPVVEIIPVAQGCVGDCSYCITRLARGCLISYPPELIAANMKKALSENVKEVWLTAQDTGAYGLDIGESLPSLLKSVSAIEGVFRVRVGMMNPAHVLGFLDELVDAYDNEKIYKFLHLPLQSGDDRVLSDMNRNYSVRDFKEIVSRFREGFPELTLSTDVILGFPSEGEEAFKNTVKVIEEVKPEVLNISRFWVRPGTKAEEMKQLPGRITKMRSRIVNEAFKRIGLEKNRGWVGWEGKVLVSEKTSNGFCARNSSYKPIILQSGEDLLGRFVDVRITEATYYDLRGEIV
ncbi:MAG: tRNA (N(6)-L-threonylcarbamoyladenosine(37)-C(2))-methylthiotransferase [Candidatus Altiarchaeota archaeon]|nr:tRNA (N(6)-L-threonylcarbamoyladenosine(37)-C(2))-methylthiotransferase [Candidatus Altiarchaeota archaeon]